MIYLFIGGVASGRRIDVPPDRVTVELSSYVEYDLDGVTTRVPVRSVTYAKINVAGSVCFAMSGLRLNDISQKLIEGYRNDEQ